MGFPSAEELRMVRAIALQALWEAARYGEYRASFRGFDFLALRQVVETGSDRSIGVSLVVRMRRVPVERSFVGVYRVCQQ